MTTNVKNHVSGIIESIRKRELALFCGAGISRNSGLPLANELKQSILKRVFASMKGKHSKQDLHDIMQSGLPFEAFMESISDDSDISTILDFFKEGEPNTNHIMIAKLAKTGLVRTILTTNFDPLIEKALEKEHLIRDRHFKVYYDEEQFSKTHFRNEHDKIIKIFKIHGSAEDKKSIRITLKAVAAQSLSDKRMNLIEFLFSSGKHRKVLILGYSCSDAFDIIPQIEAISKNQKEIIFIDHNSMRMEVENIKTWNSKNPFKKFAGIRLVYDTDKLIETLWSSCKDIMKDHYRFRKSKINWRKHIDDWAKILEERKQYPRYFVAGKILSAISNFSRATRYYKMSLEIAKEIDFKKGKLGSYIELGNAYFRLGNFKAAIEYYEKSLEITKEAENKGGELLSYINLANAYHGLADFSRTIEYSKKCLRISKEIGKIEIELRCYMNLGNAYSGLGNYTDAVAYYKKSLKISRETGDKESESTCCLNLGHTYYDLGYVNTAGDYYKESLRVAEEIGDKRGEFGSYLGLGIVYSYSGNYERATQSHEKSLAIARKIEDRAGELQCYIALGHVHYRLRDFNGAIEYYVKSLKIAREIGDRAQQIKCHRHLGNAYSGLKKHSTAICYYEKCSEIAKEIGDQVEEAASHINLGNSYYALGGFYKAIDLYLRAEIISKATRQFRHLQSLYSNLSRAYKSIGDYEKAKKYKNLVTSR